MSWYNPLSWFSRNPLTTTALTAEDEHALDILQRLLDGDKDAIDVLISELHSIRASGDVATAESLMPQFRRNLEGYERTAGIIDEILKSKAKLKRTVLEPLLSIKKK